MAENPYDAEDTITGWFNIFDQAHLRAFSHMRTTGIWPEGFVPKGMKFMTCWQSYIESKMADAWISYNCPPEEK